MFFSEPFGGIIPGARGAVLAALLRTGAPLTGRQVHGLLSDDYSLWTVQEALKALALLGIVETQTIGRAGVHTINEQHAAVAPLRALLDPVAALRDAVSSVTGKDTSAVILFGSIARGEARPGSDIDLAVIAPPGWDNRVELEDSVRTRLGNDCDVLVFTQAEFDRLAATGEPVVGDILRDGIALIGAKPPGNAAQVAGQARSCMMATAEQRDHARTFLKKAEEYLASAEANLAAKRYTPAAGDAIHAGISAKDAILTALTGATSKGKDHATAAKELRQALATRPEAAPAEKSMRDLITAKGDVEYGTALVTATKAQPLARRACTLVDLAIEIVRLGR